MSEVAREAGATVPQTALAWVRAQSDRIIPIIGGRIRQHVADNMKCLDIRLNAGQMRRLNAAGKYDIGFPQDMILSLNTWVYNHQFENIELGDVLPGFFNQEATRKNVTNIND